MRKTWKTRLLRLLRNRRLRILASLLFFVVWWGSVGLTLQWTVSERVAPWLKREIFVQIAPQQAQTVGKPLK